MARDGGMPANRPPPPRQILLIVLDDVPRQSLTAYGAKHGLTPNLDSLWREGVTHTNAFTTSPLCTPARYALLTGRYAANASSITAHRPWNLVGFNTFLTSRESTLAHGLRRRARASPTVRRSFRRMA